MEELTDILKKFDLEIKNEDSVEFEYINVFQNPNKLPINQIHLEKNTIELRRGANLDLIDEKIESCFEHKKQIIPALSKSWLPESIQFFNFEPYNFTQDDPSLFIECNKLFLKSLHYLLSCNYHQFWCFVLFEPKVALSLHSFLLNPISPQLLKNLDEESRNVYLAVFSQFRRLYQRLITFQQTESEFMPDAVGLQFLLDKKLLNLPIVLTICLLYHETNLQFVNDIVTLYFSEKSLFQQKEIEEMLDQVVLTLEMIGGHVCGFEPDSVIVPIAIEEKPKCFNTNWVFSVVDYLFNTISTLHMLIKFHKPTLPIALDKGIPYRLSFTYDKVFHQLYDYINERNELEQVPKLADLIYEEIALARNEFIDVYNSFISYCLDKTLEASGTTHQNDFVEIYLKLMHSALEDEYFVCDYHERFDVGLHNEMFASCSEIDQTRTDYLLSCITSLRRYNRIRKTLKTDSKTLKKAIEKYGRNKIEIDIQENGMEAAPMKQEEAKKSVPSEEEIENSVKLVIDMFPHLGDAFVLKCLEAYNYEASDVITAILEENLPPHLIDIPFDEIRIPPEPKPEEPILAYRGKKSDLDETLKLLNDKKDMKEIKTFILDGIEFTNQFADYDDEYDDRIDESTVPVRDQGSDDILRFNPNYEDVVSDTSYSENEYDEQGKMLEPATKNTRNFCEDPAVIRERNEARRRVNKKPISSQKKDVVGKAKGQGQEKTVQHNRQKKSVNKSSRANHNRKSGAQWKRSKGMFPS